jgi:hypothetical protein
VKTGVDIALNPPSSRGSLRAFINPCYMSDLVFSKM